MNNPIYCDICGDPTSFCSAMAGLNKHVKATCHDCCKDLDAQKKEAEQMLQRSKRRRRQVINDAYNSLKGK